MENKIKENIESPEQLETLYRSDKKGFEKAFFVIYSEITQSRISDFWKTRLEFDRIQSDKFKINKSDILFLVFACLFTGFLIKIPQLFNINLRDYMFYEKNTGIIVLLGLSVYSFSTKDLINLRQLIISAFVFIVSAIYINLLPSDRDSHSINLACLHLPLMIWCLYGLIFIDYDTKDLALRINFIKYNGDLAILGALILIAGGMLAGVTIGLFSAIGLTIEKFYFDYVIVIGLVSAPIVATFIIRKYPFVTNKIAPIIANIFSPLVLITLIIYLISIAIIGKNPYNDRDFLIVFNLMLLGVMGIIVFSVSETSVNSKQRFNEIILLNLSIITLIIDLVAISAIVYRLGEYGFTPNRTVVLASNLLVFGNLVLIMIDLFKVIFKNGEIKQVEFTIAKYLPIYAAWTVFVVFVLPFIFGLN